MKYSAIIFDMDGTILDTADDLTAAVNYAMKQCGHRHDFVRADGMRMFGSGAHTALQRALAMEAGMEDEEKLRLIGTPACPAAPGIEEAEVARIETIYRPYYLDHSMDRTGPYDGILDLLRTLRARKIRTAVVSNKPDPAVKKLAVDCFENLFDADEPTVGGIMKTAQKIGSAMMKTLGCDGINVVQNNGAAAGQTVKHLHVHLIPRYEGDGQIVTWKQNESDPEEQKE